MSTGEKSFLLNWTLITLIAFVTALATTNMLPGEDLALPIAGVITGLTMGVAQWLALRQRAAWAPEWVVATAIGFFVAIVAIGSIGNIEATSLSPFVYIALAYLVLGALVGTSQWFVLRRHVFQAEWWIPSSTIACLLGISPAIIVLEGTPSLHLFLQLLIVGVGGMTIGVLTGMTMVYLLRHTHPLNVT